ncbi:MAG: signal peptidase I [Litorimonas sp.]
MAKKSQIGETLSTVVWAVIIAVVLRTFIFQPFHIPSGSMLPGLMKGDYIITSKYSLGYGKYAATPLPFPRKKGRLFERAPKRGDVIVFRPEGDDKNFIKRLVGLPGDKVQVQDGLLYINNTAVEVQLLGNENFTSSNGASVPVERWKEMFPNGAEHIIYDAQKNNRNDNTPVRTVPAGYYFMMGDNRDYSSDSRVPVRAGGAGLVPSENLMGKAEIVLLSVNDDFVLFKPWTWGNMRGSRFFKAIK